MQITFNTLENKLIVSTEDDGVFFYREYTNKEEYLSVYPERTEDVKAMGWE